jgi:UDP-N-acetylmuramoylalanine-D-glutamate ligase
MDRGIEARTERTITVAGSSGTGLAALWASAILDRSHTGRVSVTTHSIGDPCLGAGSDIVVITSLRADEIASGTTLDEAANRLRAVVESARTAVVVNGADPMAVGLAALAARVPVHVTGVVDAEPLARIRGNRLVLRQPGGGDAVLPVASLRLPSQTYVPLAATAIAASILAGARLDAVSALAEVQVGAEMGLVTLGLRRGVKWQLDGAASSPGRALPALESGTPGRILLIAGGAYGGQPLARWSAAVGAARYVLVYGEASDSFADGARDHTTIVRCADLYDAVGAASRLARRLDSVIFAPGCMPEHGTLRFEAERFAEAALGTSLTAAA